MDNDQNTFFSCTKNIEKDEGEDNGKDIIQLDKYTCYLIFRGSESSPSNTTVISGEQTRIEPDKDEEHIEHQANSISGYTIQLEMLTILRKI